MKIISKKILSLQIFLFALLTFSLSFGMNSRNVPLLKFLKEEPNQKRDAVSKTLVPIICLDTFDYLYVGEEVRLIDNMERIQYKNFTPGALTKTQMEEEYIQYKKQQFEENFSKCEENLLKLAPGTLAKTEIGMIQEKFFHALDQLHKEINAYFSSQNITIGGIMQLESSLKNRINKINLDSKKEIKNIIQTMEKKYIRYKKQQFEENFSKCEENFSKCLNFYHEFYSSIKDLLKFAPDTSAKKQIEIIQEKFFHALDQLRKEINADFSSKNITIGKIMQLESSLQNRINEINLDSEQEIKNIIQTMEEKYVQYKKQQFEENSSKYLNFYHEFNSSIKNLLKLAPDTLAKTQIKMIQEKFFHAFDQLREKTNADFSSQNITIKKIGWIEFSLKNRMHKINFDFLDKIRNIIQTIEGGRDHRCMYFIIQCKIMEFIFLYK